MKSLITRTTAARLARFKRPDHWSQRRVEEGFAVQAGCVAASNRATKAARWDDLKQRLENTEDKIHLANVEIAHGWRTKQDPLQDMVDLHCAEMAKDPILSRAIIAGPVEAEAFANTITGGQDGFLDKIGRSTALDRLHWIEKPEIESWKFNYDPTWVEDSQLMNLWHLVWNYEETDAGLAYRIKESLGDPVVLPGAIHKIDCEIKFDFDGRSPWTKFKAIIRKEFEPLGLWCLGKMTLAIDEFKDAFPFMSHNRFADYGWPASHFARVELFKRHGEMLGVKRFPFEPNWMFRKRMLKSIRGINQSIQWPAAAHLGRAPLKPLNLAPFYKLLAVAVGLLVASGFVHHFIH